MGLMRSPQGVLVDVPETDATHAMDLGYTPESDTANAAELTAPEKEGTGLGGAVAAGTSSFLSGLTLGGSDLAARGLLSKGSLHYLADAREAHPVVSAIGNVAGTLAPTLITGGAAGEIAAATPAGYLSRLAGEGVEGAKALGGIKGALGTVAVSGAEGAAMNAGMYLSDVALGNRDLTAEGVAGALGSGFAFGSVAGGATYGLEAGTMAARRLFAHAMEGGAGAAGDAASAWSRKSDEILQAHDDTARAAKARLDEIRSAKDEIAKIKASATSDIADAKLDLLKNPARDLPEAAGETQVSQTSSVTPEQIRMPSSEMTPLEQKLQEMKTRIAQGERLQELSAKVPPPAEEQELAAALDDYAGRRAKVNEWVARIKNPRTEFIHPDVPESAGVSPLVRGRVTRPLDEDVFIEQSGGGIRTIGKGEHALADITPNSRILARSNADTFSHGSVLDDAYNDAIERARLAETRPEMEDALREASDIEQQIHGYIRSVKPENAAVIDQIGKVRAAAGQTGYHAALARAEAGTMREAEATGVISSAEAKDFGRGLAKVRKAPSVVEDVHEAATTLGDYEKSAARLTEAVGPTAPPAAQQAAADFRAAEDAATRKQVERTTRAIDDHVQRTPEQRIADARKAKLEADAKLGRLKAEEVDLRKKIREAPRAPARPKPEVAPPQPRSRVSVIAHGLEKVGSGLELASMAIPGIPHPSEIPVIGPLLGAYLKFRAFTGKLMGRIPATGEAKAAALASRTKDGIARSIDRSLGLIERSAPAARQATIATTEALGHRLFDDGGKNHPPDASPREMAAVRVREISAAAANPEAILAQLREQMRDVKDPDLLRAAEAVRMRQVQYLAQIIPLEPPPSPLAKKEWTPSVADTSDFAKCYAVAMNPSVAFEATENGTITPKHAEALQAVYPQLYQQAAQRLMEKAAALEASVPFTQRMRLSLLYNVPLDRSLDPETIGLYHTAFATKGPVAPTQNTPPTPSVSGPVDLGKLFQTPEDRRAARS